MHTPVLLNEAVEGLDVRPGGKYIDATVGEGGHLKKILEEGGNVLAIDWDKSQIRNLEARIANKENIRFVVGNFAQIKTIAEKMEFYPVDGILFDLGLSMEQIARSGRGFSYKNSEEPLDMRIGIRQKTTAGDIVNTLNEDQLYNLFAQYGEELDSRPIAKAIVQKRTIRKLQTVGDLTQVIDSVTRNINVSARIFQALRIAVNQELENIRYGLEGARKIVKEGGRIVVITFHSREDRIVKQFARKHNLRMIIKKPMRRGDSRSFERSARLRIIFNTHTL